MTVDVDRRLTLRADAPQSGKSNSLVARGQELAQLRAGFRSVETGGRAIVIAGDAGTGKSALLAAFRREVRDNGSVAVEGACVEIESRHPFGAFADLISSCERAFGAERVARLLSEHDVSLRQLTAPRTAAPSEHGRDRYQVHAAILGLLSELASDGPLVVLVEDLHWADPASLELFGYLVRRMRTRPVLLIATYRSDELDRRHPLRPALAELRNARLIEELALAPLDIDGTGALVQARLGLRDPAPIDLREFRDLVHARCEGNPLHTEETLDTLRQSGHLRHAGGSWSCDVRAIRDSMPASVADGVVARWSRLSQDAQDILLVASVAGHHLDLDLIADVGGTPPERLASLVHEAIDARLVNDESADGALSFRHALTREALQRQLLTAERVALHRKIAEFLELRRASPVRAAELAYHLDASGSTERASRYYEIAAHEAAASTDYAGAARSLERAIASATDGDEAQGQRNLTLVKYQRRSGNDPRARRAAAVALEIGQRSQDARLSGRALLELYTGEIRYSDNLPKGVQLQQALALLEPLGPSAELSRVYSALAANHTRQLDADPALEFAQKARATASALALPAELAWATMITAGCWYLNGELGKSLATAREAVELAEGAGLVEELYQTLMQLRLALAANGASQEEQREARSRMRAVARAHGLGDQFWIIEELGFLHLDGQWDEFLRLLPQVPEPQQSDFDVPQLQAMFTAVARRGPSEMTDLSAAELRGRYGKSSLAATWATALLLVSGRSTEAVELASAISDEGTRDLFWGLFPASLVHTLGLFAARDCNDAVARDRFVSSLLSARPLPAMPNFNQRHHALASADLAERAGDTDAALAAYEVALAECERSQYFTEPAYQMSLIRQRRAELFTRAHAPDVVAAQAEIDALLPYWQNAKATWYLEQLRSWAEQLGLAFPAAEAQVAAKLSKQLTRREIEVARLVAQGLTNREIGERLTLSVRTAESHVEQIRAKLGFKTRTQIASWVTERYGPAR